MLHGYVPAAVRSLTAVDRLAATNRLNLAISLPLRNTADLTNLLGQIYDPASTNYHRYLTSAEFAERFGPTEADYEALADFARANGFTVTHTHPNRTLLDVNASVADIERALHLTLRVYRHPREARNFHAPDAEPSLDLALPVLDISGLDDFEPPRPMSLKVTPLDQAGTVTPNAGTGSGFKGEYWPVDLRNAYLPGVTLNGAGQSIGLLEFDGYYASDIASYVSQTGSPSVPLTNVLLDSFSGAAGANNIEVALDIEMAIAFAPGLSRIMVYEGTMPNDILNQMATDNQAKQLSSSWTWSGYSNTPSMQQIFQQYATQGQSFFNASGDTGASTGTIEYPADDTNITIVGGTTLFTTGPGGAWSSETVWSTFPSQADASSGGISPTNAIPVWQQGIDMTANQGSTSFRNVPDVAYVADNLFIMANNGTSYSAGGTSAATPLWAAFTALVNQQAVAGGHPTVGFLNPALYAIGKGATYNANFHDITTGNNTNVGSPNLYFAVPGYDLCTGWGTPTGSSLINVLATPVNSPFIIPAGTSLAAETCTPTNGVIDPGETVTVNFALQNAGTAGTTNLVATLLATGGVTSPSAPRTYGVLAPGGAADIQRFTFTANGACGGTITATLQLQDGTNNLGSVNFALTLGLVTNLVTFTQSFDGVNAPNLPSGWTTTHSGSEHAWVTSTANHDTGANAAFASESQRTGLSELISPAIGITLPIAQLNFRHSYNTDAGFDGGVLEIQIGAGAYADIQAAGGSFVTGGYDTVLGNTSGNPIGGRAAWTGNTGGFITTTVNLPAAAAGQSIHLKWRFGTDNVVNGNGWYVDTISIIDGFYTCCSGSPSIAITQVASTNLAVVGRNLAYTITVTNQGSASASTMTVTDTLPAGVTFVSASAGGTNNGGTVQYNLGPLASGAGTNLTLTVLPTATGADTNNASVTSTPPNSNQANSSVSLVTTVDALPAITVQPTNQLVVAGTNVSFSVTATGTPAPGYQWFFNGTNLTGATANVLVLTNVQPNRMGNYTVLVTNLVGSSNSLAAALTVLVPPAIQGVNPTGTNFSLSVTSLSGLNYTLEYKNALTDANWISLSPTLPGNGGVLTLQDTNAPVASRFYRVRCD
jgi:uncharacterized repeat protein (TIGR01451 family)